jgi:hypothetical protein
MRLQKSTTFSRGRLVTEIAPFALMVKRLFGLDAGDWSVVLFGFALAGLLLVLF